MRGRVRKLKWVGILGDSLGSGCCDSLADRLTVELRCLLAEVLKEEVAKKPESLPDEASRDPERHT